MTLRAHTHRCYGLKAMTGKNLEQRAFEERLRLKIEAYHEAALVYAAVKLGPPRQDGRASLDGRAACRRARHIGAASLPLPARPGDARHLQELPDGTFALAPGGWSLRSDSHSRLNKKVQIVVEQYWHPWADLVSCLKTGKPAFDHVFGMSVWDVARAEPRSKARCSSPIWPTRRSHQAGSILEALESCRRGQKASPISAAAAARCSPLS